MFEKFKKNNKIFFVIALLVLADILFFSFLFFFTKKLIVLKDGTAALQSNLDESEKKIERIKNLETFLKEIRNEMDLADDMMLTKDKFINLVQELEFLAAKSNVKLIVKSASVPEGEGARPNLSIEVKGSFSDIFKFMKMLENMPYSNSINRFVLQKESKGFSQNVISENNDVKMYPWMANIDFEILNYKEN